MAKPSIVEELPSGFEVETEELPSGFEVEESLPEGFYVETEEKTAAPYSPLTPLESPATVFTKEAGRQVKETAIAPIRGVVSGTIGLGSTLLAGLPETAAEQRVQSAQEKAKSLESNIAYAKEQQARGLSGTEPATAFTPMEFIKAGLTGKSISSAPSFQRRLQAAKTKPVSNEDVLEVAGMEMELGQLQDQIARETRKVADYRAIRKQMSEQAGSGWLKPPEGENAAAWILRTVGQAVPSVGTGYAVAPVSPWAGAALLGQIQGIDQYVSARDKGIPIDEANRIAVTESLLATVIEHLPLAQLVKLKGTGFSRFITQGGNEGVEEIFDQLKANAIAGTYKEGNILPDGSRIERIDKSDRNLWKLTLIDESGGLREESVNRDPKWWDGLMESFVGGFGAGGIAGALHRPTEQPAGATLRMIPVPPPVPPPPIPTEPAPAQPPPLVDNQPPETEEAQVAELLKQPEFNHLSPERKDIAAVAALTGDDRLWDTVTATPRIRPLQSIAPIEIIDEYSQMWQDYVASLRKSFGQPTPTETLRVPQPTLRMPEVAPEAALPALEQRQMPEPISPLVPEPQKPVQPAKMTQEVPFMATPPPELPVPPPITHRIGEWSTGAERPFAFDPNSTKNEGRFRLQPPESVTDYFRRKSSTDGVSYVMGKDVSGKQVIQAIRFNKSKFTETQAADWYAKNAQRLGRKQISPTQAPPVREAASEPIAENVGGVPYYKKLGGQDALDPSRKRMRAVPQNYKLAYISGWYDAKKANKPPAKTSAAAPEAKPQALESKKVSWIDEKNGRAISGTVVEETGKRSVVIVEGLEQSKGSSYRVGDKVSVRNDLLSPLAETPIREGGVSTKPIGSFVTDVKDSTGTWIKRTVPVLSVSEPRNVRGKVSGSNWAVDFETPSTLGKTGKTTKTQYFTKKTDAQKWIDSLKKPISAPEAKPPTTSETGKTFYHGSDIPLKEIQGGQRVVGGKLTLADPSKLHGKEGTGRGFVYLAESAAMAKRFGHVVTRIDSKRPLKILNPVKVEDGEFIQNVLRNAGIPNPTSYIGENGIDFSVIDAIENPTISRHVREALFKAGYDGIYTQETDEEGHAVGRGVAILNEKSDSLKIAIEKPEIVPSISITDQLTRGEKVTFPKGTNAVEVRNKAGKKAQVLKENVDTLKGEEWKSAKFLKVPMDTKGRPKWDEAKEVRVTKGEQIKEKVAKKKTEVEQKKEAKHAIRESGAGAVLQRPPEGVGERGGERERVEPGEPGAEVAVPEKAEEVGREREGLEKPVEKPQLKIISPLSRNVRENIRHKIFMALMSDARLEYPKGAIVPEERSKSIREDAVAITDVIDQEYASKGNAGALWLAKQIKNPEWLAQKQEQGWMKLRESEQRKPIRTGRRGLSETQRQLSPLAALAEDMGGLRVTKGKTLEDYPIPQQLRARVGEGVTVDLFHAAAVERGLASETDSINDVLEKLTVKKRMASEEQWWKDKIAEVKDWEKTGSEIAHRDKLNVGDTFTIRGEKFTVLEEMETALRIADGVEYTLPYEAVGERATLLIDKGSLKTAKAQPEVPEGQLFAEEEMPFNLVSETVKAPEVKPVEREVVQTEMFPIEKVVESKDPRKSADAALEAYGTPAEAIRRINGQMKILDSDPVQKKAFTKEQRTRLKEVLKVLEQRLDQAEPLQDEERLEAFKRRLDNEEEASIWASARTAGEPFNGRGSDEANRLIERARRYGVETTYIVGSGFTGVTELHPEASNIFIRVNDRTDEQILQSVRHEVFHVLVANKDRDALRLIARVDQNSGSFKAFASEYMANEFNAAVARAYVQEQNPANQEEYDSYLRAYLAEEYAAEYFTGDDALSKGFETPKATAILAKKIRRYQPGKVTDIRQQLEPVDLSDVEADLAETFTEHLQGKQTWNLLDAGQVRSIWTQYARDGFVRNAKAVERMARTVQNNLAKIIANSSILDRKDVVSEEELDRWNEHIADERGHGRYSRDGVNFFSAALHELEAAKTAEEQLLAIDRVFNIVHGIGNAASWFVKGGKTTLKQLAYGGTPLADDEKRLANFKKGIENEGNTEEAGLWASARVASVRFIGRGSNEASSLDDKARSVGFTITYFEGGIPTGATDEKTKNIFIRLNDRSDDDILRTIRHEVFHALASSGNKEVVRLVASVDKKSATFLAYANAYLADDFQRGQADNYAHDQNPHTEDEYQNARLDWVANEYASDYFKGDAHLSAGFTAPKMAGILAKKIRGGKRIRYEPLGEPGGMAWTDKEKAELYQEQMRQLLSWRDAAMLAHRRGWFAEYAAKKKAIEDAFAAEIYGKAQGRKEGIKIGEKRARQQARQELDKIVGKLKQEKREAVADAKKIGKKIGKSKEQERLAKFKERVDVLAVVPPPIPITHREPLTDADYKRAETGVRLSDLVKQKIKVAAEAANPKRILGIISTRLKNMHPALKQEFEDMMFNQSKNLQEKLDDVTPLLKKVKRMSRADRNVFSLARLNGDAAKIQEFILKYKMGKEYALARKAFDDLFEEMTEVGFKVRYQPHWWGRKVKDHEGLLTYIMGTSDWSWIEAAIRTKEAELAAAGKPRKLTREEQADFINYLTRGYSGLEIGLSETGSMKQRMIEVLTPEMAKYYYDADTSALKILHENTQAIGWRQLFGRGTRITQALMGQSKRLRSRIAQLKHMGASAQLIADTETKLAAVKQELATNKDVNLENLDDSIGMLVLRLMGEGKLNAKKEREFVQIVRSLANARGPGKFMSLVKNASYLSALGSPVNALTQLGDIVFSYVRFGAWHTTPAAVRAFFRLNKVTKEMAGIHDIVAEFSDIGWGAKTVARTFKMVGLDHLDRVGKETTIGAGLSKIKELYKRSLKGDAQAEQQLNDLLVPVFGDQVQEILEDLESLRKGEVTRNMERFAYQLVADYQPVSLLEVPEAFLTAGNGRILYMLKTFQLKQIDVYRNWAFSDMAAGIKMKDKKRFFKGFNMLLRLLFYGVLINAGVNMIKNLLLGREPDDEDSIIPETVANAAWGQTGISKFQIDQMVGEGRKGGKRGPFETIVMGGISLPFGQAMDDVYLDIVQPDRRGFRFVRDIPLIGKMAYWWFGRGAKLEKKRHIPRY